MLINWTVLLTAFFWHITWALYNEKQISISKLSTKPVSNLQLWRHNAGISCTHLSAAIAIVCWHISLGENVPKSTHSCFTGETSKTEACFCIYPAFCHNLSAFRVVWIGIATVSRKDSLNAFHELLGSVTYGEPWRSIPLKNHFVAFLNFFLLQRQCYQTN